MDLKVDCRHFRGDKPCKFACGCERCMNYAPMGRRILIIKLDAIGDVARTTPILKPLRNENDPCYVTWLVHPIAADLLRDNPLIEEVLPYCAESLEALRVQRFDLVLSLDKTPRATAVATGTNATEKLGFGLSEYGTVFPLNPESEYAFKLGLDDELKFKQNTKTYQEVIFDCVKLPYNREEYAIEISQGDHAHAEHVFERLGIGASRCVIGVNMGGGSAFAHKMWNAASVLRFVEQLSADVECEVVLFGANRERDAIDAIMEAGLPRVHSAGVDNTLGQFQALLGQCAAVVTGDSLGMHLAIAGKRPVIVLFGPTCAQEIELYGRGETVVSPVDCAPCYRRECDRSPTCMEAIEPGPVIATLKRFL